MASETIGLNTVCYGAFPVKHLQGQAGGLPTAEEQARVMVNLPECQAMVSAALKAQAIRPRPPQNHRIGSQIGDG